MDLNVFQELTEQITLECFFMTDSQQEEKVIQLIDLHHFIECYNPDIKIINNIHHSVNIIEENNIKNGILFYDLKHSSSLDLYHCEAFKQQHQLQEMWFVFVEEDHRINTNHRIDFIIENSLEIFYDRLFIFNFFQSTIKQLK
ncbi:hypothetical protein CEY12_06500 [Chryseobacterium sp. T16E-39]|uniref:hypothetical protein n=1 Tax=Chryseobacterium sp. T16E-39 TaxID=2015076 RepID=UPI000B5B3D2B|nr:hypothetical protein [Chryseobacterium sp. T16E-39]ASK29778.1 hypothetical protein CEY12_06500 [Chryseobacterium sp. T16E-39]